MKRRHFLALPLLSGLLGARTPTERQAEDFARRYHRYIEAYLAPDGRIQDSGNAGISHSEGQGVSLLFAACAGDHDGFRRILGFTRSLRRLDRLFSWKFADNRIADPNNATDGDIYIAWALLVAARRFGLADYRQEALETLQAIRTQLVQPSSHGTILLPGIEGFSPAGGPVTINLSYWIQPAFALFAQEDPSPLWAALTRNGQEISGYARFGKFQLPPDWLKLTNPVQPADERPAGFGYDAIRIPLFLAWAGQAEHPLLRRFLAYATAFRDGLPGSIDLVNDQASPYKGGAGHDAVVAVVKARLDRLPANLSALPVKDYYSDSLVLLAMLASSSIPA